MYTQNPHKNCDSATKSMCIFEELELAVQIVAFLIAHGVLSSVYL